MICPHCSGVIPDKKISQYLGSKGGAKTSPAKTEAVRRNLDKANAAKAEKKEK
jgi:hypothetical protein